jgi:hypothetical protein
MKRLSLLLSNVALLLMLVSAPALTASPTHANETVMDARTWSPSVPMTVDNAPSAQSEPAIASTGNHVVVVWTDSRNAAPDIYASVMLNGNKPSDSRVSNIGPNFDTQRAFGASVTIEPDGRAFAAYSDGADVYLVRYDLASGQWLSRTRVNDDTHEWYQVARYPSLSSDGNGNVFIAWEDYRNISWDNDGANDKGSDVYAEVCNGNTMACGLPNVKVNDDSTRADQRRPKLSRSGNSVVVAWEDGRERGAEFPRVYAAFSSNGGTSFGANMRVSKALNGNADVNSRDSATAPAVTYAPDGSVYAIWEHHSGSLTAPADIYAAQWTGSAWANPLRVDNAPHRARAVWPVIAASGAGVFAAWQDHRNGAANPDIYSASLNSGNWVEQVANQSPGAQTQPVLSGGGNAVSLAWQSTTNSNADVFVSSWNGSGWVTPSRVNEAAARAPYQTTPEFASNGGLTYAAFLDTRDGYKQLYLQQLDSQLGLPSWKSIIPFPTRARDDSDLEDDGVGIAFDANGVLHAVWSEYHYEVGKQINYSAYANSSWSEPVRLSGNDSDTLNRTAPVIATRGNTLAVVWSFRDASNRVNLYATTNTGTGSGWSTPAAVLQTAIDDWVIPSSVALDSKNTLFVAYSLPGNNGRQRVVLARRGVAGGAWSYTQVSPDVNADWCLQQHPQVRVGGDDKVHVIWSGCALRNPPNVWPHDSYIFYASSTNGGVSFGAPVKVGLTIPQDDEAFNNDTSSRPAFAIGNNSELVVLYPRRNGNSFDFYATVLANGVPGQAIRLSTASSNWAYPDQYFGMWYGGDSRGAVIYDAAQLRYVVAYPDRQNGRSPRLYAATYGDNSVSIRKTYLPLTRR